MIHIPAFTNRENDVLNAMLDSARTGGSTGGATIARQLVVSERTVQTHLARMFKKAGVHDMANLLLWAVGNGNGGME